MPALTESIALGRTRTATARKAPSRSLDTLFRTCSYGAALLVLLVLAGILGSILYGGWPAFREFGFGFLTSSAWNVGTEQYGALVAVIGTVASAFLALLIGVPVSLGIAVYLTQLCPG
ncbi:phosphate ABC transporter permease subunit PstC, partial [Methylobacterium organophilum]|nr:phosphate ABC transporter permease subunit PstC [Methylobacterium organophilum]